jgi:hypothetical protein
MYGGYEEAPWVLGFEYYLRFNGVAAIKLAISCPYLYDRLMAQTLSVLGNGCDAL